MRTLPLGCHGDQYVTRTPENWHGDRLVDVCRVKSFICRGSNVVRVGASTRLVELHKLFIIMFELI